MQKDKKKNQNKEIQSLRNDLEELQINFYNLIDVIKDSFSDKTKIKGI